MNEPRAISAGEQDREASRPTANLQAKRVSYAKAATDFYKSYIRHLPAIPVSEPLKPGRVYHLTVFHDDWCRIYSGEGCNCKPIIRRYAEPTRS
jgi:hypothetical protein